MSEQDPAIIGVQSCGCITYAHARPDRLSREDERALAAIVREGGHIERVTVAEARRRPYFLVGECPHDPKGWERSKPKPSFERMGQRSGRYRVRFDWKTVGVVERVHGVWQARRAESHADLLGEYRTRGEAASALVKKAP